MSLSSVKSVPGNNSRFLIGWVSSATLLILALVPVNLANCSIPPVWVKVPLLVKLSVFNIPVFSIVKEAPAAIVIDFTCQLWLEAVVVEMTGGWFVTGFIVISFSWRFCSRDFCLCKLYQFLLFVHEVSSCPDQVGVLSVPSVVPVKGFAVS